LGGLPEKDDSLLKEAVGTGGLADALLHLIRQPDVRRNSARVPDCPPGALTSAVARADEAARPPQRKQVVPACLVGREPSIQFQQRSWVVLHDPKHYGLELLESSTYPSWGKEGGDRRASLHAWHQRRAEPKSLGWGWGKCVISSLTTAQARLETVAILFSGGGASIGRAGA
jgi:hypothetical protein